MLGVNLEPKNLAVGNHRIHYAWATVALAAAMRLSTSSFRSSQSILIPRLVETFGWSYGSLGGAFALQWIVSGAFSPPAGWMGDRYGVRVSMTLGALLFILGMVLTSTVTHLWQFYVYFGLILSASMGIFQVPLTAAVTLWFKKHLGLGMGVLNSAQGLGPLVAVPIIVLIVQTMGLRAAFWLPGVAGGIFILFLIRLFYNEPADVGLRPLGADETEPIRSTQRGEIAKVRSTVFLRQARRTSAFWNLIGIHYWGCAGHAIVLVFLVAMAEDRGVSAEVAAGTFVVLSVFSTLTRFAVPVIADLMGSKGVMAFCFFLQTAPILLLFFAHDAWMFYLFAALFGIGFGGEMTAFPIINRQYYGSAPIGTTLGWQMMGAGFGMASGAALGGLLRDATGDFNATMGLSLALSLVGVLSILKLPATSQPLLPHWEDELHAAALPETLAGGVPAKS
ncbi:MAG: hypothetical protein BZY88_17655 [SAR202 cluster bacterium Io17-Chloro-G9]|nr:MAG: hypothetical protein BZY88_17655 [SAR202 cluster bacterium Io17-Chloro-G9]